MTRKESHTHPQNPCCHFRKFDPAWIRVVRQNHRIIRADACNPASSASRSPSPRFRSTWCRGAMGHCRRGRPSFAIIWRGLRRSISLWFRRLPLSNCSRFLFSAIDGGNRCGCGDPKPNGRVACAANHRSVFLGAAHQNISFATMTEHLAPHSRPVCERWASEIGPPCSAGPGRMDMLERLIGSIRHECLDHLMVFNAQHLRRILAKYATYYNEVRTHVSLGKDAPCTRPIERFGDIVAYPILGGLHHRYARI
jgi:Integrase core domain